MNLLCEPVRLEKSDYSIEIGRDLSGRIQASCAAFLQASRKVAVITDTNVATAQAAFMKQTFKGLPLLTLPSGEPTKCLESLKCVYDFLAAHSLERDSCIIAFGGGVIGDLVGFAAATYLRGIAFYQVPTTLLAAVDSSVGGKTGINLDTGKNMVGAFHQPDAVFTDVTLLETLPPREFNAGMSEVIKYGLLGDAKLFEQLESLDTPLHPLHPNLPQVIRTCCALKAAIVQADEREQATEGGRALLNLGHTFGHAIETATGYHSYLHGEAVSIGLVLAGRLSQNLGLITAADVQRITTLLQRYALPVSLDPASSPQLTTSTLIDAMNHDKKIRKGKLRFVVLQKMGKAITLDDSGNNDLPKLWRSAGAID